MAGTAEAVREIYTSEEFYLEELGLLAIGDFRDADTIPELHAVRKKATIRAHEIIEENMQHLREGEHDMVPIPVDALGTARHLAQIEEHYGKFSPEYAQGYAGLKLDSKRLLTEVYSKNRGEYFFPTRQEADPETGDFYSHGIRTIGILERGLSPLVRPEEIQPRIGELVEEVTYKAIGRLLGRVALVEPVESFEPFDVITVSECADWAIEAYKIDPKASHDGYVPGMKKYMARVMHFVAPGVRFEELVAASGEYITHDVFMSYFKERGALAPDANLTKTELRAKQFINTHNEGGALAFQAGLDKEASEIHGKNIFMGEEVPADHPKDYQAVVLEAADRQDRLDDEAEQLAHKIIELEKNNTDRWAATGIIDVYVKNQFLKIAEAYPELAEAIFDKETADRFAKAADYRARGLHDKADAIIAKARAEAPEVSYCTAGSCGLEAASSINAAKARELGLQGDEILHDTERSCPGCHTKNIYYDTLGNKACINCKETQIKE